MTTILTLLLALLAGCAPPPSHDTCVVQCAKAPVVIWAGNWVANSGGCVCDGYGNVAAPNALYEH